MKHHQRTIGKSDEWGTPEWIMQPLGMFDLDPCAMKGRPLLWVKNHLTIDDDGLDAVWSGRVWLNPPFHRYRRGEWMRRMAAHGNGIMLIPAACETESFQQYVFGCADGILMLDRRPRFVRPDGAEAEANSGCTICLVAYGHYNLEALKRSGLGPVLVEAA